MTQPKIDGKFYPLQHQEWVQICKTLTKSQLSVLFYLRTLDPYSNGIRVKSSLIAAALGITKRSVNAAIATLAEKHFIEIEDAEYQLKISARGLLCQSESSVTQVGNEFPTEENNFSPEKTISQSGNEFPTEENNFSPEKTISRSTPETPTQTSFETSKTHKTYTDFIKTLSESEREKFLNFVSRSTRSWNPPINDISDFLAKETRAGENRWEVYYQKFISSPEAQSQRPSGRELLAAFHAELEERRQRAEQACQEEQQ